MTRLAGAPLAAGEVRLLTWIVRMGAVTTAAAALREERAESTVAIRLRDLGRSGLVDCVRPVRSVPALWVATRAGARACGLPRLGGCRVSVAAAAHWAACSQVSACLERRHGEVRVVGEREIRLLERDRGSLLFSAVVGGGEAAHRPDLALVPDREEEGRPLVVEVELTLKAPRRLERICRGWARADWVGGVVYYAPARVARGVQRAIDAVHADDRIAVAPLACAFD